LAHLDQSVLVLERTEFENWYRSQRHRKIWPSQRPSVQAAAKAPCRPGRPRLKIDLKNTIINLIREGAWSRERPVRDLRGQLRLRHPHVQPPSDATIRRRLDELRVETGEPGLIRRRKA
jgi:hypothetical protein